MQCGYYECLGSFGPKYLVVLNSYLFKKKNYVDPRIFKIAKILSRKPWVLYII